MANNDNTTSTSIRFTGSDPYDFEGWYPLLKELTFPTTLLQLNLAQAEELIARCGFSQQCGQLLRWGAEPDKLPPAPALKPELLKLQSEIQAVIDSFGPASNGAFVRLSTRSPKDAVYGTEKLKTMLREELRLNTIEGVAADDPRQVAADVVAFVRASCFANQVITAEDAIQLLGSSQRVLADLTRARLEQGDKSDFTMGCIVRQFSHISPEYEFRIFVHERRVVAITQYYKLCFVPAIAERATEISAAIVRYIEEQVNPRLVTVATYTADLVLDREQPTEKITLIEINHPPPLAGQALFSWDNPADRNILEGKQPDLAFRVRMEPQQPKDAFQDIYQPLLPFINEYRGRQPAQSATNDSKQEAEPPKDEAESDSAGCLIV